MKNEIKFIIAIIIAFVIGYGTKHALDMQWDIMVKLKEANLVEGTVYSLEKQEFYIIYEHDGQYMKPRILTDFADRYYSDKRDELYKKMTGKKFVVKGGGYIAIEKWTP